MWHLFKKRNRTSSSSALFRGLRCELPILPTDGHSAHRGPGLSRRHSATPTLSFLGPSHVLVAGIWPSLAIANLNLNLRNLASRGGKRTQKTPNITKSCKKRAQFAVRRYTRTVPYTRLALLPATATTHTHTPQHTAPRPTTTCLHQQTPAFEIAFAFFFLLFDSFP